MPMFEFEDSPNAELEGNRTTQAEMARVVRSPGLKAKNNEAMAATEVGSKPSMLRRALGFVAEHAWKIVVTVAGGLALAWLKSWLGI